MEKLQITLSKDTSKAPVYPPIKNNKSKGWIEFGAKNDFPRQLIEANSASPTNKSINNSIVTYICGKGAIAGSAGLLSAPNSGETWDDVIEPTAKDYTLFGGYYWQVHKNKDGVTVSVFHQDFSEVRVGKVDEFGTPLTFMISKDWKKATGKTPPIELEAWNGIEDAKDGEAYIFHHWDYEAGLNLYCIPRWYSAFDYIIADGELGAFYKNSINNGFTPSVVISMPTNPPDDVKRDWESKFEDAFTGSRGASKVVTLWGANMNVKPTITPFVASNNADIYNNVESIIFQKIVSSHQLSSPTLAGVSGSGSLSGNASEIIDSFILFNYTVVERLRAKIVNKLNIFTGINKTATITIEDLDVVNKIKESESDVIAPKEGDNAQKALATEIGVGGTQALTQIVENSELTVDVKRGLLKSLFGLLDEDVDALLGVKETKLASRRRERKFITKFKQFLSKWNL